MIPGPEVYDKERYDVSFIGLVFSRAALIFEKMRSGGVPDEEDLCVLGRVQKFLEHAKNIDCAAPTSSRATDTRNDMTARDLLTSAMGIEPRSQSQDLENLRWIISGESKSCDTDLSSLIELCSKVSKAYLEYAYNREKAGKPTNLG